VRHGTIVVRPREMVRLVDHVKAHLVVVPVSQIGGLIAAGKICVGARVGRMAEPVEPEAVITVDPAALAAHALVPEDVPLVIHHEDADLLICDKPAGMHVHPIGAHHTGTLLNALLWHCGARPEKPWAAWRPAPAHRLDRAASGLVAIAKAASIHDAIRRMFAAGGIHRRYRALVHGRVQGDAGTVDAPLGRDPAFDYRRAIVPVASGGQPAVTHWTVVERSADRTLVELTLETGRTHQIRAHLASLGHPIVGDTLYRERQPEGSAPAISLHATELRLRHPRTGVELVCTSRP